MGYCRRVGRNGLAAVEQVIGDVVRPVARRSPRWAHELAGPVVGADDRVRVPPQAVSANERAVEVAAGREGEDGQSVGVLRSKRAGPCCRLGTHCRLGPPDVA